MIVDLTDESAYTVLIDTWWNVNATVEVEIVAPGGF